MTRTNSVRRCVSRKSVGSLGLRQISSVGGNRLDVVDLEAEGTGLLVVNVEVDAAHLIGSDRSRQLLSEEVALHFIDLDRDGLPFTGNGVKAGPEGVSSGATGATGRS